MVKINKKKLTCFPSDRRWPNVTVTAEPAVWSRDGGARCCYYCCCYACAPCWRCCPWESLARFYPPERWATVAFSLGCVWRSTVGDSFDRPRLSLRKTGLLYTCGLKASNPQTLLYVARTGYLYERHRTLSVHELRSRSTTIRNSYHTLITWFKHTDNTKTRGQKAESSFKVSIRSSSAWQRLSRPFGFFFLRILQNAREADSGASLEIRRNTIQL